MSNKNKDKMTKQQQQQQQQQQDDLASSFTNLPWGLPLGFPSMPAFGAFPPFGLPTHNFGSLNSFASSSPTTPTTTTSGNTGAFPPPPHSLLPSDPTNSTDLWSNG